MKFLADESLEYKVVLFLRGQGCDVLSVAENFPSTEDRIVLDVANREQRILLTNDKDFGELIFRQNLNHKGVILFRMPTENANSKIVRLEKILKTHKDKFGNNFTVVTKDRVRIRKVKS